MRLPEVIGTLCAKAWWAGVFPETSGKPPQWLPVAPKAMEKHRFLFHPPSKKNNKLLVWIKTNIFFVVSILTRNMKKNMFFLFFVKSLMELGE